MTLSSLRFAAINIVIEAQSLQETVKISKAEFTRRRKKLM